MHRFSIIVPMLGDRRLFDDTLASVLRYRPRSSQVIVAHDGTYDDPYRLDEEVDFVSISNRANLVPLFYCAVGESTGTYVALIRPGIQLDEGWDEHIESTFEETSAGSVSPVIVTPAKPQTIVAAGVSAGLGLTRKTVASKTRIAPRTTGRIAPLGPTSWAAFYRRSALEQVGPGAINLDPHYLDLDLAMSLDSIGYSSAFCPECVVEVERSTLIERELTIPHGRSAQRAFRRHATLPGSGSSVLRSVSTFASELLLSTVLPWKFQHAIGRLGAWKMAKTDRHFSQHLSQLAAEIRQREELGLGIHRADKSCNSHYRETSRRAA